MSTLAPFVVLMMAALCPPSAALNPNAFLATSATMGRSKPMTSVTTTSNACPDAVAKANASISSTVSLSARRTLIAPPVAAPSATVQPPACVKAGKKTMTIVILKE